VTAGDDGERPTAGSELVGALGAPWRSINFIVWGRSGEWAIAVSRDRPSGMGDAEPWRSAGKTVDRVALISLVVSSSRPLPGRPVTRGVATIGLLHGVRRCLV